MAHPEEQVSALERALRNEAATIVLDTTANTARFDTLNRIARMIHARDEKLYAYTKKLESTERFKFIGMGLRDILEAELEIKDAAP